MRVVRELLSRLRNALPEGRPLPEDVWRRRHRGIVALLWLHAAGIFGFGLIQHAPPLHALFEASVELMGGEIGANSVPGRGSTFWVQLSLATALPQEEMAPAVRSAADERGGPQHA